MTDPMTAHIVSLKIQPRPKTRLSTLALAVFGLTLSMTALAEPTTPPLFTNADIAKPTHIQRSQKVAGSTNLDGMTRLQTKSVQIKAADTSITDRVAQELLAQQQADGETGEAVAAPNSPNSDVDTDSSLDGGVKESVTATAPSTNADAIASIIHRDDAMNNTRDGQIDHQIDHQIDQGKPTPTGKTRIITSLSDYENQVNSATWSPNMRKNTAMTVKIQALLGWNHASPGPIDGGWGMNSKKALANFQVMQHLPATGSLNTATWQALTKNIEQDRPALTEYRLTEKDVNTNFIAMPASTEAKSKLKGLYYQNIKEMLGERFHMDVRYLEKLNKGKQFVAGDTITVINVGNPLKASVNRIVANKAEETLYAYHDDTLVATYPTTVGSSDTPSPQGTFKIVNKVKMPWYKATVGDGADKKVYMLAPGPNNPVGVVWMGLSKPSYGIHGSPSPEGISRQASHGCIRLTNWDVIELYANIEKGATVELT